MVFIRKPRLCCWCSYTKVLVFEGERVQMGHCKWTDMQTLSWKCFIMFSEGTQPLQFDLRRSSVFHMLNIFLCNLVLSFKRTDHCVKYWIYWTNTGFHNHRGRKVLQYMAFWCLQCVFTVKQTLCDLHLVTYLNFGAPSLCLSLSKEQNLSNGNQLDVTESPSPDWQENSHE